LKRPPPSARAIRQIVKTLLVRRPDRRHIIALVRGDQQLSLKRLARLAGVKVVEMAPPRMSRASPAIRSAPWPPWVCAAVMFPFMSISTSWRAAGKHQRRAPRRRIDLDAADLIRAVHGQVADITE